MKRMVTTSTEGKRVGFSYDGEYYLPNTDKKAFFKGKNLNSHFYVAYTTVVGDWGYAITEKYGISRLERYDNGLVGHQSFNGFNTIEEAKKDYELRKRLSPKTGIHAYCDVFLIDVNN